MPMIETREEKICISYSIHETRETHETHGKSCAGLPAYERYRKIMDTLNDAKMRKERDSDGEIIGVRKYVESKLGITESDICHCNSIFNNLGQKFKNDFSQGRISLRVAYHISRLDMKTQNKVLKKWENEKKEDKNCRLHRAMLQSFLDDIKDQESPNILRTKMIRNDLSSLYEMCSVIKKLENDIICDDEISDFLVEKLDKLLPDMMEIAKKIENIKKQK